MMSVVLNMVRTITLLMVGGLLMVLPSSATPRSAPPLAEHIEQCRSPAGTRVVVVGSAEHGAVASGVAGTDSGPLLRHLARESGCFDDVTAAAAGEPGLWTLAVRTQPASAATDKPETVVSLTLNTDEVEIFGYSRPAPDTRQGDNKQATDNRDRRNANAGQLHDKQSEESGAIVAGFNDLVRNMEMRD